MSTIALQWTLNISKPLEIEAWFQRTMYHQQEMAILGIKWLRERWRHVERSNSWPQYV